MVVVDIDDASQFRLSRQLGRQRIDEQGDALSAVVLAGCGPCERRNTVRLERNVDQGIGGRLTRQVECSRRVSCPKAAHDGWKRTHGESIECAKGQFEKKEPCGRCDTLILTEAPRSDQFEAESIAAVTLHGQRKEESRIKVRGLVKPNRTSSSERRCAGSCRDLHFIQRLGAAGVMVLVGHQAFHSGAPLTRANDDGRPPEPMSHRKVE